MQKMQKMQKTEFFRLFLWQKLRQKFVFSLQKGFSSNSLSSGNQNMKISSLLKKANSLNEISIIYGANDFNFNLPNFSFILKKIVILNLHKNYEKEKNNE